MSFFRSLAVSAAAFVVTGASLSYGVTITGDQTYIRSDNQSGNYGGDVTIILGTTTSPATIRGLLSFSLASIPAGSQITDISLVLKNRNPDGTTGGPFTVDLHQLTKAFAEGTGTAGAPNTTVGASWTRTGVGGVNWTTPGGDFGAVLSSFSASTGGAGGLTYTFGTSSAFVQAAQAALNGGQDLSLLMKLSDESTATRKIFFLESDNSDTAGGPVPQLIVNYIPEPSSMLLSSVAALGLLRRRRR
jgi:PEP-CTERM putative exosortase interaction domain